MAFNTATNQRKLYYMNKTLLLSALLLSATTTFAANTVKLDNVDYALDTLFHAKIGPGTTQTSLVLTNMSNTNEHLRVFYLTSDLNTPNVSVKSVVANDKLAGGMTVSNMAISKTTDTRTYFAGVNTDFFQTGGTASNGLSIVGSPVFTAMADGEVYLTRSGSNAWPQVFIDDAGNPNIGPVTFNGTATCGDKTAPFSVVNYSAGNNTLSLYTPKYYGIMNQPELAGQCAEVTAKMIEGNGVRIGDKMKFEVTSTATETGNREIPDGEYLIAGRGNTIDFVKGLKVGDVVEMTLNADMNGASIVPRELATGNPHILKDGVTLDSEGDRGDASALHPRTGVGYGKDKTMMVMMVIDGRSGISAGVHTKQLADMMKYAGATDAINVDGGGSAALYTQPLGIRNKPSDGHERADASGMFLVADAPADDKTVTEIQFVDWSMKFPKYGIYTPVFYGYNKYGVLVDTDLKGVTLSCDSKIGEIINDGTTFYGTGDGIGALTASYNGITDKIPVVVSPSDKVNLRLQNLLIDNKREYPVEVLSKVGETDMPINAGALSWTSSNSAVAEIGADNGILKGKTNGSATITGTVGEFTGNLNVTVEIPTDEYMPIIRDYSAENFTLSQKGGNDLAMSQFENGFKLSYTGASGRKPNITIDSKMQIWSLPTSLRFAINPGEATIERIYISIKNALGEGQTAWYVTEEAVPAKTETEYIMNLADWCDPNDLGIYPITISTIRFEMGKSETGKDYEIAVPKFEAFYGNMGGITENTVSSNAVRIYPNPVRQGESVSIAANGEFKAEVFALNGAKVGEYAGNGEAVIPTASLNGVYVVKVTAGNDIKVAKMVVK